MNNENLRHLSHELGDEWQLLAHHLNVRRMRIQAIIKNQRDEEGDEGVKYDMLMTWLKKMPHGVNKVTINDAQHIFLLSLLSFNPCVAKTVYLECFQIN